MNTTLRRFALGFAASLTMVGTAFAGSPQLDNGSVIDQEKPYDSAQVITDVYQNKAVYGKLDADSSVDIYKFTPDKDGEQNFSLVLSGPKIEDSSAQPLLIMLDKTDATEAQELNLPLPADGYHAAVLTQVSDGRTYLEPALFRHFTFASEQKVALKKDTDYYFVVIEPYGQPVDYALKMGDGNAWKATDIISSFGSWVRIQTNTYSGSTPFSFSYSTAAFLVFMAGFLALVGIFIVVSIFSLLANRSKSAAYLLVKLQPFSRLIIWVSMWFIAIGGYMYFTKAQWVGIPFVLFVLFIVLVIVFLYDTLRLSPQIAKIEVSKKEASIPLSLRKRFYFSFVIELLSILSFITLFSIYIVK